MIHIDPKPEPVNFDKVVRQPGVNFLSTCPLPSTKQWNRHSYWRKILDQLHRLYGGICAYSCHWIPEDTGADTVEHFRPKNRYPHEAYEWSNYRLVCATLNARKGLHEVLDPFAIPNGWFILDFPSLLVKPSPALDAATTRQVLETRDRLKLNDEATCLGGREHYVKEYCKGNVTFEFLRTHAPFIAMELERQGLVDAIKIMMRVQAI